MARGRAALLRSIPSHKLLCPRSIISGLFPKLSGSFKIFLIGDFFYRLMQKLGEEGPGQDLQASYLSMKIGGMFQEVIAMFVPVLNQSSSAPFQAIIGTTSDILLAAKPGSHFSLSGQ
jgi:hypothetical protein